jgi:hypothetical protein
MFLVHCRSIFYLLDLPGSPCGIVVASMYVWLATVLRSWPALNHVRKEADKRKDIETKAGRLRSGLGGSMERLLGLYR